VECDFLVEQNITLGDIIDPLEDIITEEFIGDWLRKKAAGGSKLAQTALNVGGSIASGVKNLAQKIGGAFSAVFKFFGLAKLTKAIGNYIKNTKLYKSIKEGLSSLANWALQNGIVDENNVPNLKKIWSVLSAKCKSLLSGSGVDQAELDKAGQALPTMKKESYRINEADANAIGDDEVKYYGFFEKVVHALGIQNARLNGVVSQILKKGTIGVAIMGILKLAGFSLAALTAGLGLGPVALAAIGGMLLMAGLIILAIWICKPYPTVEDCLAYLHIYFTEHSSEEFIIVISTETEDDKSSQSSSSSTGSTSVDTGSAAVASEKSLYPMMIKNLQALQSMIISYRGVSLQSEGGSEEEKEFQQMSSRKTDLKIGKIYTFTNKDGKKSAVKLISKTNDIEAGSDKKYLTKDDKEGKKLASGNYQVLFPNKNGSYTLSSPKMAVRADQLSESNRIFRVHDIILEKEFSKNPRNIMVGKEDDYTSQAVTNVRKSIKSFLDDKLKVDKDKTIVEVIEDKMTSETKEGVKTLYSNVYEYLFGKYSKTLSDVGALYKESVVTDSKQNLVFAEKIARLYKRTQQFEGENMYGTLGEFGADMKDFNTTMKQIMDSLKSVKENYNRVFFFQEYIK
jgi:hypothetical protein